VKGSQNAPATIDVYITLYPPEVQAILQRIRAKIRKAAPDAEEVIGYGIPAFVCAGPLVYFGAFRHHIGFYPPVRDGLLRRATVAYEAGKGNLRFPLDKHGAYALIARIVKARLRENRQRQGARGRTLKPT
jgi:uncharacterized protein YdhG (YjbR/CyaY superfamily)